MKTVTSKSLLQKGSNFWGLRPVLQAIFILALLATLGFEARAEVRLPKVFGSHMVLQQGKPLTFWGWAEPNEKVTVRIATGSVKVKANGQGEWKATLQPMKAGGPFRVEVTGATSGVVFQDVMIGEVWLCSGQSNMEMGIGLVDNDKAELAAADQPGIRLLMVANRWSPHPQTDIESNGIDGTWKICSPKTLGEGGWGGFSATAYFYARELHQRLGVTVGVIDATWGGTRIESWTPPEGFASVPSLSQLNELVQLGDPRTKSHQVRLAKALKETENWVAAAKVAMKKQTDVPSMPTYPSELLLPHDLQNPTALFNGMISPLCPFTVRGAIWYQGEANNGEGMLYAEKMKALIGGWRQIWGDEALSFYFVQIAPYNYGGRAQNTAELWEAQTAAQAIPHTGMAVVNDVGNLNDIHPKNKQEVGRRLALWALSRDYGFSDLTYSGPTYKAMSIEGDKIRIAFDHADKGLVSRDGKPLSWFEIIDADDGSFVPAKAEIDGATVVLSAPSVKHPVAMRFAWSMLAEPNLMNGEGLPAGAFRAGTVPKRDFLARSVPEAKDYQLVYDLDLANLGRQVTYTTDNHKKITQPFDRIAYCLELQLESGEEQSLFVSMDAFTADLSKIGVPTIDSKAFFRQNVTNMNIFSNVKSIACGTGLSGGNIEFWPNNYIEANSAGVPNASGNSFDFGDQPVDPVDGHGSMQVHNHDARQTLFALNHWNAVEKADLGIGNRPEGQPDWTFAANAGRYEVKRLRVLVRCK